MLNFIIGVIIITIAGFIGTWFYSVIFLPLFYGIPKALHWSRKGVLKYTAIFAYLKTLLLWIVIFSAIVVIVRLISYSFFINTLGGGRFFVGFIFGNILSFVYSFSKKSRQDLQHDFWSLIQRYRKLESASETTSKGTRTGNPNITQIDKKGWRSIQFLWLNLLNILGNYEKAHFELGYINQHMKDCFDYFKKTSYADDNTRYHFKIKTDIISTETEPIGSTGVIDKELWMRIRFVWTELLGRLKHYSKDCDELEYAWYRLLDLLEALDRVPYTEDGNEYKFKINTIEEKRSQKYHGNVHLNVNIAGMIINEMNYIVRECNKYIKKEEFDESRLIKFDFVIASIYIALVLKHIEKYEIYGLEDTLVSELKDFFRSFVDPDKMDESSEGFDWLVNMINYLKKTLPPLTEKDHWHLHIDKYLSETAESEIKEFFISSYDKSLITVLLNHVELTAKYLKEKVNPQGNSENIKQNESEGKEKSRLSVGVYIISILFIILGGSWVLGYIVNPGIEMSGYFIWGIPYLVGSIGMLCRKYWALRFSQVYLILTALPYVGILIWALFQPEKESFLIFPLMIFIGTIFWGLPLWFLFKKSTVKQFKK